MASLTVRDIPEATKKALAERAAEAGVSLEAFMRLEIEKIANRAASRPSFVEAMRRRRAAEGWTDDSLADYINEITETERRKRGRRDGSPFDF